MKTVDWNEGEPVALEAGMIVQWHDGQVSLIGHYDERMSVELLEGEPDLALELSEVVRWAWLIKPHELDWLGAIGVRKP